MSKKHKETYDATLDAVTFTLSRFEQFYASHPDLEDSVAFYFEVFTELVVKGWKDIEYLRHPYNYNAQLADYSDKSPRTLRHIYNKK